MLSCPTPQYKAADPSGAAYWLTVTLSPVMLCSPTTAVREDRAIPSADGSGAATEETPVDAGRSDAGADSSGDGDPSNSVLHSTQNLWSGLTTSVLHLGQTSISVDLKGGLPVSYTNSPSVEIEEGLKANWEYIHEYIKASSVSEEKKFGVGTPK